MPPKPWQDSILESIKIETPETKTFRLRLADPMDFLCGQYVNIRFELPERGRIQRAYSIDSSPAHRDFVDLTIRRFEEGTMSKHMADQAEPGQVVPLRGPFGNFTWTPEDGGPLFLAGAGSGIVPLACMIRYCDDLELYDIPITLLYSSKSWDYVIHRDELADFAARMPNLEIVHTFTRSPEDRRAAYNRRIDLDMIKAHLRAGALCYLCGPPAMVEAGGLALADLGVEPARIKLEKYD